MRKYCRFAFAFVIVLAYLFTRQLTVNSATTIAEKVRVGLYFGSNAVSTFGISGENGLLVSCFKDNTNVPIFEESANKVLTVKKDDYYHIQIGKQLADLAAANAMVMNIKAKGIDAFVTYFDGWFVWSGSYITNAAAQTDIDTKLKNILGAGEYSIATQKKRIVIEISGIKKLIFESTTGILRLASKTGAATPIIYVNNIAYRGNIDVIRQTDSDMTVVNNVLLDEYLYGVVPNEIGINVPTEALKAQAVAARSFALRKIAESPHSVLQFDLCAGTHCQVYGGYLKEADIATKAIDATTHKVLTFQGQFALAVYSASNGGVTESSENVWYQSIPYLKSEKDNYDPVYSWEKVMTSLDIKNILGGSIGDVQDVKVTKYAISGRVIELVVKGTNGIKTYTKESCRTTFNLKSQLFTITADTSTQAGTIGLVTASGMYLGSFAGTQSINKLFSIALGGLSTIGYGTRSVITTSTPKTYIFSGKGTGHAIGMSQEGVISRAKAGLTYDKILSFYYPGTVLE